MARIVPATPESIAEAARIVQAGGLVAFPTETVYGLGADALNSVAVAKIFVAKGRPATNPLIVHLASADDLGQVAEEPIPSGQARPSLPKREGVSALIRRFWPGPLTLVLPKRPSVPDAVTAGGPTVAVRVPRHPVARALIAAAGRPLAAPSANRSEAVSPTLARHVAESLGGAVDLILDGGPCEVGLESTVLDVTVWPPRLLRPGLVTTADLEDTLGMSLAVCLPGESAAAPARAPGQRLRHYAPRAPLHLCADPWAEAARTAGRAAVLGGEPPLTWPANIVRWIAMPPEPRAYAAALYAALHELDRAGADGIFADRIFAADVPDTPAWDAARDRLRRAAHRGE